MAGRERRRRRGAVRVRADRRRALEPDLPRRPTPAGARGSCAGRRSASRSAPRTTWAASTGSCRRCAPAGLPVPAPRRAVRGRVRHRRGLLRHGLRRRARAARRGRGRRRVRRGRPAADRLRARRHARRPARASTPARSGSASSAASDGYAERQLRRWKRQWDDSKTRELDAMEEAHRRLSERVPRAARHDARARRLPPGQRDPRPRRRRSPRSWTGSCARSATRSPTSAC